MSSLKDSILNALTDHLNGDTTPDEFVSSIVDMFRTTGAGWGVALQQEANKTSKEYLKKHLAETRKQTRIMQTLLETVVATLAPRKEGE